MALVFAAITPHPPLLIPTIGKRIIKKVDKTRRALLKLEEDLYARRPDTVVIISPHGTFLPEALTINFCEEYRSDLREFGDLTTNLKFRGGSTLANAVRHGTGHTNFKTKLISETTLDHGSVVPLYYLLRHLKEVPILPIGFSDFDAKTHFEFGTYLKEVIVNTNLRVAIIASGDLSHALTTDAPAGFNPRAAEFDATLRQLLETRNSAGVVNLDANLIEAGAECGLRSILILLGVMRDINYSFQEYSYEAPFGVGYLTANFVF
ncbi:MAG: class III extradiol dioxygenase subunit B-like domain-containing protein [Candidatus Magasanikbacteria bacterium]|nr:class III extradiol dioxygenase subunit B-like domain-containing protein [Candidatus Magasanikbacteria bacterium]